MILQGTQVIRYRPVVSLLIVNSDNLAPSQYASVFQSVGLDTMAYSPTSSNLTASAWPTLGELIDDGKRLVVFLSTEADFSSVSYLIDGECSPGDRYQD